MRVLTGKTLVQLVVELVLVLVVRLGRTCVAFVSEILVLVVWSGWIRGAEIPEPTCDGSEDDLDVGWRQALQRVWVKYPSYRGSRRTRSQSRSSSGWLVPSSTGLALGGALGLAIRQADLRSMIRVWSSSCSSS